MRSNIRTLGLLAALQWTVGCGTPTPAADSAANLLGTAQQAERDGDHGHGHDDQPQALAATVVAAGIPGAGAVAQIQEFHRGSPFHDNPTMSPFTGPGQIFESTRLFVASSSNFGAPMQRPTEAPGSILSIDLSAAGASVPPTFAAAGDQASASGGAIRLYTANSPAYRNSRYNPGAATADLPGASLPTGISSNNGHGRPWFSNAPNGVNGYGTITVIDPDGAPLKGAPSAVAGGVFAGDLTNRNASTTHGLTGAALSTTLLTKSPDGSGKAVFAAPMSDGSVVQIHVLKGVDQLAPPGTIHPLSDVSVASAESNSPTAISRAGIAFNWAPSRIVYVADPLGNRIVALDLADDGVKFSSTVRAITSESFNLPVDLAPVIPETEADNFASNTTLGAGSDLYVLNRGNNTIVRITQGGEVVAVRSISTNVPGFRANGIATSATGAMIYVTGQTAGSSGVVLKMSGFGSNAITAGLLADASAAGANDLTALGSRFFSLEFTPAQGVGPLFNGQSCSTCHNDPVVGGMGLGAATLDFRVGRIHRGQFQALKSPVTRAHSIEELGEECDLPTGIPDQATVVSTRSTMTLRGTALIDDVSDQAILAAMNAQPAAVRGHPNYLDDGRIGRFGWKADVATLVEFMGDAYRNEMGVTNALQPKDLVNGCGANKKSPEIDAIPLVATARFLNTIDPPLPTLACLGSAGAVKFQEIGCASCHTPSMAGPGRTVNLYSDLLVHDMGPGLADGVVQFSASGNEFRTMPLWRVADRGAYLHDGRASSIPDAVAAHGGQAANSAAAFQALAPADRQAVLDFLGCI